MLFADFCTSETSETLCAADPFQIIDQIVPSVLTGLAATDIMIKSVTLTIDRESSTNYEYNVVTYDGVGNI